MFSLTMMNTYGGTFQAGTPNVCIQNLTKNTQLALLDANFALLTDYAMPNHPWTSYCIQLDRYKSDGRVFHVGAFYTKTQQQQNNFITFQYWVQNTATGKHGYITFNSGMSGQYNYKSTGPGQGLGPYTVVITVTDK